ncbi:MAG: hydrolase [Proteobacteria bacterium]|nr:hydrolase [Pseudomonadota bacterium]
MNSTHEFIPAWWCHHRHLQTLYPALFRKPPALTLKNEQLELPDGDFIDLSWTEEKQASPIVILLHGLEGSKNSPYAKGILKTIQDIGWQGVLMHFRGCSGRHNRLDRSYHSGETGDLDALIQTLRTRHPDRKIAAIGVSLGGNVLLKYLGEQGNDCKLTAAMAISVPFDLADGARALNKGFSKIYQRHLIKRLCKKMRDKFKDKPAPIDIDKLGEWTNFYLFDHNVTAPLHGFSSADDYYTKSSSKQFLKDITTPTLILHSKDDPFMTQSSIPTEEELSSNVTLELTEHGGHVGFVSGESPFSTRYWIEKRLVEFFKDRIN